MFERDSADTFTGIIPLVLMGGQAEGLTYADLERGPPLVLAEFPYIFSKYFLKHIFLTLIV